MTEGAYEIPGPTEPLKRFPGFLDVGTLIDGRYEVTGYLGEGGFATLYRARHIQIQREVALKVLEIPRTADDGGSFADRFLREARIAASIDHPNVVTIHDFGSFGEFDQLYIAMELLHGHDLDAELERTGRLEPKRALRLMCECLGALGCGHKLGIVHKDLKPANLFLTHPGERRETLILLDFGVAIKSEQHTRYTQAGEICGTPRYLAPEYIDSQTATAATDVYQMGLVLAEMLLGEPVVKGDTGLRCIMEHLGGLALPRQLAGLDIGRVIRKALSLEPEDRFANAIEFQQAILAVEDWNSQAPVATAPSPPRTIATDETQELVGAFTNPAPVETGPVLEVRKLQVPAPPVPQEREEPRTVPLQAALALAGPTAAASVRDGPINAAVLTGPVTAPLRPVPMLATTSRDPAHARADETARVRSRPIKSRYHARCIAAVDAIDKVGRQRPTGLHYFRQTSGGKPRQDLESAIDAAPWPNSDTGLEAQEPELPPTVEIHTPRAYPSLEIMIKGRSSSILKAMGAVGVVLCLGGVGLLVAIDRATPDEPSKSEDPSDVPAVAERGPAVLGSKTPGPGAEAAAAAEEATARETDGTPKPEERPKAPDPVANQKAMLKTLASNRAAIEQCYEKGRKQRATLAGTVTVKLTAQKGGKLASAAVLSDSLGDDKVARCITAKAKRWRYPIEGDRNATLITSFTFPRPADSKGGRK
jgi:hypothetical protein